MTACRRAKNVCARCCQWQGSLLAGGATASRAGRVSKAGRRGQRNGKRDEGRREAAQRKKKNRMGSRSVAGAWHVATLWQSGGRSRRCSCCSAKLEGCWCAAKWALGKPPAGEAHQQLACWGSDDGIECMRHCVQPRGCSEWSGSGGAPTQISLISSKSMKSSPSPPSSSFRASVSFTRMFSGSSPYDLRERASSAMYLRMTSAFSSW